MRDKILGLIAITIRPVDTIVDDLVKQCQTLQSIGTVPAEFKEASELIASTFQGKRTALEDKFVEIWSRLTEEEIDQLLAIYQSPLFKKVAELLPSIVADASSAQLEWASEVMNSIEPDLRRLLGTPGTQPAAELPPDSPPVVA